MKSYTVDFESFEVEANTYEDAKRIATNQAWDNHGMRLDDDLIQEGEQKTDAEHLYNEDGTISRKLKYDEYKLRFKYRVFKNGHKWAPLFYSELKGKPDFTKWVAEQKLIFNRKFNNINFSFNPILELEFELDNGKWEKEIETEFAAGLSYDRGENFSYGIDLKSSEYSTYIGPVLAHGNEDKWWTIGIMKKVAGEDEKAELVLRSIMGFHF